MQNIFWDHNGVKLERKLGHTDMDKSGSAHATKGSQENGGKQKVHGEEREENRKPKPPGASEQGCGESAMKAHVKNKRTPREGKSHCMSV